MKTRYLEEGELTPVEKQLRQEFKEIIKEFKHNAGHLSFSVFLEKKSHLYGSLITNEPYSDYSGYLKSFNVRLDIQKTGGEHSVLKAARLIRNIAGIDQGIVADYVPPKRAQKKEPEYSLQNYTFNFQLNDFIDSHDNYSTSNQISTLSAGTLSAPQGKLKTFSISNFSPDLYLPDAEKKIPDAKGKKQPKIIGDKICLLTPNDFPNMPPKINKNKINKNGTGCEFILSKPNDHSQQQEKRPSKIINNDETGFGFSSLTPEDFPPQQKKKPRLIDHNDINKEIEIIQNQNLVSNAPIESLEAQGLQINAILPQQHLNQEVDPQIPIFTPFENPNLFDEDKIEINENPFLNDHYFGSFGIFDAKDKSSPFNQDPQLIQKTDNDNHKDKDLYDDPFGEYNFDINNNNNEFDSNKFNF